VREIRPRSSVGELFICWESQYLARINRENGDNLRSGTSLAALTLQAARSLLAPLDMVLVIANWRSIGCKNTSLHPRDGKASALESAYLSSHLDNGSVKTVSYRSKSVVVDAKLTRY
jgi:hypothetical protein